MTIIDKELIELFGATVEFNASGDALIGYCCVILDNEELVVEVSDRDYDRKQGTYYVKPEDVLMVEIEQ